MRILKFVALALGSLVVLLIIVLLAVRLFVNPNDYKDRIARAVKNSTGRELALPGEIKLSVFPWIALELGPASLGNAPGFGAGPFATVKHAALRVKLFPLLRKQLQIGRIEVDGLELRLFRNAEGKGNWEDFGSRQAPAASSSRGAGLEALRDVAGIEIKDSRLNYQDLVADHVNLDVGRIAWGSSVPISLKLDLTTGPGAPAIGLAARFRVVLAQEKKYRIAPLELDATMSRSPGTNPLPWKFSAPAVDLDLAAQTLSAPAFTSQLAGAHLAGSLRGVKILAAPSLSGSFKLDPVALRELMHQFGITPPQTRDPKALSRFAASGDFRYGDNAARASKLDVQLDDSRLRGAAAITDLDARAMDFDLALDHIDLDRYRSAELSTPKAAQAKEPLPVKSTPPASDPLKALRMNGTFTIGSARIAGLTLTQMRVSMAAKDGVAHIAPAQAKLYGGSYSGNITLNDLGATPAIQLDQTLTDVDVAPLLKDFANMRRISGHGNVTTHLTAHGLGSNDLLRSLNGHVAANLANGAVEGIDLWFEVNRALAVIQKQSLPAGTSSGRTKFDVFKASADLTNGVAATRDLTIASQNLRVTGQGTMNLVTQAIDYQVKATLLKDASTTGTASGRTLADIPLTITGTMIDPKVRPDLEGIAKARVQQELNKHKQELQQKLQDQLKDLFK